MAAGLIELTQAHNISLEPQDEVDADQLVVLASLADEQDGAAPFDLDDGAVANFIVLRIPESSSKNADLAPIIWFVAPMSRTHHRCSCCLPLSPI